MRCPGCPPSVPLSSCFSWPSSAQQSTGKKKQAACIFSNELSKQEMAHLLVREARNIAYCRATGTPYQSPLQLAIKRASAAKTPSINKDLDIVLVKRSGPYAPVLCSYSPDYVRQYLSSMRHFIMEESMHHHPQVTCSAHTARISSAGYEVLPEQMCPSQHAQQQRHSIPNRSLHHQSDDAYESNLSGYRAQGSNKWVDTSKTRAPMSAPHSSRTAFGNGKRRAYLNPNGFENGFVSMPGSFRTSSVSDACHINPGLYESEYRQSSSSYCHFRPGLGNTYFYN